MTEAASLLSTEDRRPDEALIIDVDGYEGPLDVLLTLARAAGLEEKRAALFAGEKVNTTEHRPALHMALRNFSGRAVRVDGRDVMPDIFATREKLYAFANQIRDVIAKLLETMKSVSEAQHQATGAIYGV